jgi:hypothetical protein
MIRERYYYAVAAFMRKDGKLTYTSVTSSVKGGREGYSFLSYHEPHHGRRREIQG